MKKFAKYSTSPVQPTKFFTSPEAEKEFNESPEAVRKQAMHLLEACCKQSMEEPCFDMIDKKTEEIEERLKKLIEF